VKVVIADDEPLARRGIRVRLERIGGVEIVAECGSGATAIRAIRQWKPDVVFLDVQMPGLDGFDVVREVGADLMPVTIFVTAYETHAIEAFDADALDYLLKPIDDERFVRAVERARRRLAERRGGASAVAAESEPATQPNRILVRDRGRVLMLDHDEIDWIAAEGDYVRVYAGGRGHLVRDTMVALESRLDPARFARVHRSAIVNVSRVREVKPHGDRDYVAVLRDGTRLKVSRTYRRRLPS
jgi:two-component system LytT family response regulator